MIYELIGRLTVKAARYWLARKAPPTGVLLAIAGLLGSLVVVAGVLAANDDASAED